MLRKHKSILIITLLAVALLVQACAGSTPSPTPEATPAIAPTQEPASLKVAVQPFLTFAPYYIAQQEGFFADQGLEVELVNFDQAELVIPALASGQVDVSSGLVSAGMFNAIGKSGNMKITSDKGYIDPQATCPSYALIARSDLANAIQSAADLKGRVVDTVPATFLEQYLAELLKAAGLSVQDVTISNLPAPAEAEAFANQAIDLTMNSEPWITRFLQAGHLTVLDSPNTLLPGTHGAVQLFGQRLMDDPDLGNRFMIAYLQGVQQYNQGKSDRNIQLISEFTKLDAETLQALCWPAMKDDGKINAEGLVAFQEWAKSAGYQETILTPDQFLDGRFVDFANGAQGSQP